jgi:NADPH-dependent curcumin reductase CurA
MADTPNANRKITLRARPEGLAGPEHFDIADDAVQPPEDGEVLVETLYLSVDPAMRVWLNEDPGYVPPVEIGEVMRSGGVGRVLQSRAEGFVAGDIVLGRLGWQSRPTLAASSLQKPDLSLGTALDWMGPLGTTALTAYFGLLRVGELKAGDTVLVSAAMGAVGQMAGQIAQLHGARTIAVAGGPEKCALACAELGFDDAIDYKATDHMTDAISRTCPQGVDVYFDNVGGEILDAAIANIAVGGRVVICGRISQTAGGDLYGLRNTGLLIGRRARMAGFVVTDYASEFDHTRRWLSGQLKAGRIKQKMHILDGLDHAPQGLTMLFQGENQGKLLVKVAS